MKKDVTFDAAAAATKFLFHLQPVGSEWKSLDSAWMLEQRSPINISWLFSGCGPTNSHPPTKPSAMKTKLFAPTQIKRRTPDWIFDLLNTTAMWRWTKSLNMLLYGRPLDVVLINGWKGNLIEIILYVSGCFTLCYWVHLKSIYFSTGSERKSFLSTFDASQWAPVKDYRLLK